MMQNSIKTNVSRTMALGAACLLPSLASLGEAAEVSKAKLDLQVYSLRTNVTLKLKAPSVDELNKKFKSASPSRTIADEKKLMEGQSISDVRFPSHSIQFEDRAKEMLKAVGEYSSSSTNSEQASLLLFIKARALSLSCKSDLYSYSLTPTESQDIKNYTGNVILCGLKKMQWVAERPEQKTDDHFYSYYSMLRLYDEVSQPAKKSFP